MRLHHSLILLGLGLAACADEAPVSLRLNEIQLVGTHNSYKAQIDPMLFARMTMQDPARAETLDYWHAPLSEQLDAGMRNLELDVAWDAEGGLYANPLGYRMLQAEGATGLLPHDRAGLDMPGFKALHIQDVDFRSHCATFEACLADLAAWSTAHPRHVPVIVTMNLKSGPSPIEGGPAAPKPDPAALKVLDETLVRTLGAGRLFTPDDLRGNAPSIAKVLDVKGWPTVDDLRGRFIFVIDERDADLRRDYAAGDHIGLRGRAMFMTLPMDDPAAAITVLNDPIKDADAIAEALERGMIVRTRADADTMEARTGDTRRRDAAFASGAQIVTTDYYQPDIRFSTGYAVQLPGGGTARCNPVTAGEGCVSPAE